jgi:HEAT repeat protein
MCDRQQDLFTFQTHHRERLSPEAQWNRPILPAMLDDAALIAAIPSAGLTDAPALAAEAGSRKLVSAVPALEHLCNRLTLLGADRPVPEQIVALRALKMIGGPEAAQAVARLLTHNAIRGPGLQIAVSAAAQLRSTLSPAVQSALLRHRDPTIRADACRCARATPEIVALLIDLLEDLREPVAMAAAFALGRMSRPEARPLLLRLLRTAPSAEAISTAAEVADEECIVLIGRIARTFPDLSAAALEALSAIDDPLAARLRSPKSTD